MLLKALYDLAYSPERHILDNPAFELKAVRWIIELDRDGNMLGQGPIETGDGKRGQEFLCPTTTRSKLAGGVAEFLADGITAIFGLDPDPDKEMTDKKRADRDANNAKKMEDYWRQLKVAGDATASPLLHAVLAWKTNLPDIPSFLEWRPTSSETGKGHWAIRTATGALVKSGPDNFTFRVDNHLLIEDETIRQWWRDIYKREIAEAETVATRGVCLVSGKDDQPIPLTHPKIFGVPNTQSFGASIVSFDKNAFASYGFDQNLNAPVSGDAAAAYCAALNWLLEQKNHHLAISGSVLCFWARESEQRMCLFSDLLNSPQPDAVRKFILSPWAGIPRAEAQKDQFFAVTLAGNSGRIAVRHWMQCPLEQAIENLQRWFRDLHIEVPSPTLAIQKHKKISEKPGKEPSAPLSLFRLACTSVREAKDLQPEVPAMLYRAALEGLAPKVALLKPILHRLHSRLVKAENYHMVFDESRFALLKLIVNRNRKESDMEIQSKLTADTTDPAYNCGRLLAVLAATQDKAGNYRRKGGPGVAERYYGGASTAPSLVFPLLLGLNRHHLDKIAKSDKYAGDERFLKQQIQNILVLFKPMAAGVAPDFPRALNLQAQGRFAIGFYQQAAQDEANRRAAQNDKQNQPNALINQERK